MAKKVLLTGATGFIGRRLLTRLLEKGHQVRAVSRRPPAALDLPAHPNLELYQGDALDASALPEMLEGMDAAFYLIHSMEGGVGNEDLFVERDRQAALNFSRAVALWRVYEATGDTRYRSKYVEHIEAGFDRMAQRTDAGESIDPWHAAYAVQALAVSVE